MLVVLEAVPWRSHGAHQHGGGPFSLGVAPAAATVAAAGNSPTTATSAPVEGHRNLKLTTVATAMQAMCLVSRLEARGLP